jgi:hypothetical protein
MAVFDQSITIPGPNPGDKEIETVGTDGLNPGMEYLQRRVSFELYPWIDMGAYFTPRFALPGGKASADPPRDYSYKFDAADEIELPAKPVPIEHTGPSMVLSIPAEDNDNLIAMLEGRKLRGIPRHNIERLQRQCRAIREASLQTHINPNGGKKWRNPTIRIHTYPKGMAFAIAAE